MSPERRFRPWHSRRGLNANLVRKWRNGLGLKRAGIAAADACPERRAGPLGLAVVKTGSADTHSLTTRWLHGKNLRFDAF